MCVFQNVRMNALLLIIPFITHNEKIFFHYLRSDKINRINKAQLLLCDHIGKSFLVRLLNCLIKYKKCVVNMFCFTSKYYLLNYSSTEFQYI